MALRRRQLLRFASALVLRGRDPNSITSLRDIVDIDTVKEGLRFFLDRSGGKPTNAICDIAHALKSVARHYVRVDQTHLDSLAAIVHRLWPDRQGLTEKNRARLRPFDDANNVAALLGLPEKLMALAARARRPRDGALLAQTAAAIETLTLTFAPLRLQNLVGIDCEENLVRSGRGNLLHIVIPARDVKNTEPLECPLPAVSAELIMRYVRDFEVNPHLFRHLNAKLYLDANPGHMRSFVECSGIARCKPRLHFYTGSETAAACRHVDETILNFRAAARTRALPQTNFARR